MSDMAHQWTRRGMLLPTTVCSSVVSDARQEHTRLLTRVAVGDIMITEEERVKLGFSPKSLKIQHPVTGKWGYRAGVEVFHQLHCLNLIRQAVYKEYYSQEEVGGDVAEADGQEDLNGHVGKCLPD